MWIARDKDGELGLFSTKPEKDYISQRWVMKTNTNENSKFLYSFIDPDLFPELKWWDKPIEVELIRKENNK
jgi:hypothetical protein